MTLPGRTRVAAREKTEAPERAPDRRRAQGPILRRALGNQALADLATAPPIVDSVLRTEGEPLNDRSRSIMESGFGRDFSAVRLHTGALAARSADAVGANAYTVGNHVVMGAGFVAGSGPGQRLLAHELTHVVQQENAPGATGGLPVGSAHDPLEHEAHAAADRVASGAPVTVRGSGGPVVRRDPKPTIRTSGPVDWKPGMRATLLNDVVAGYDKYGDPQKTVKAGTLVEVVANPGFGVIQVQPVDPKARGKEPLQVNDIKLDPVGVKTNPALVSVPVQYELLDPGPNWGAAATRSTSIGAARGIGYLLSPPVRGGLDPLLPLASRLGSGTSGPLGISGDVATLERYLTSPAKELTPRYASEVAELFFQQKAGQSWWQNNFGLTERQLGEMPGLVVRMSRDGLESLAPAEQQLVLKFLQAHAQNVSATGQKIASPALSTTMRQGLSAVPEAAPFFREAPYVVRIQVPVDAALDVNATMGAQRLKSLVYEAEVLVFTDARGAITNVRPNPVSALGRAAPTLRWAGRGFIVLGAAISVGRIATATPQELPRVVGEEGGGWLGGLGGSALGAGACILFGIATEGIGLFLCGLAGGIGGGLGGSYVGGELGEAAGNRARGTGQVINEIVNPMIERALYGDKPIPAIGYVPPARGERD